MRKYYENPLDCFIYVFISVQYLIQNVISIIILLSRYALVESILGGQYKLFVFISLFNL